MKRAEMRRAWKEFRASAPNLRDFPWRVFVRKTYGFELK